MTLWFLAIVLLVSLGLVGYYQGAIRVAFSLVGLLLATLVCVPVGKIFELILPALGLEHPLVVQFVAPVIAFLLIMIIVKSGALVVHKRAETWYKYKATDTHRLLWERLMSRLGICLGLANATIYFFLICTVYYIFGYAFYQLATSPKEPARLKLARYLAADLEKTGLAKVVAGWAPVSEKYFDAVDILADIFHNPLLQGRLSQYPPFLQLAERAEFASLGTDMSFQRFWQEQQPSFAQFFSHEKLHPLFTNIDLYKELLALVGEDLKDLKTFFETGTSPKYDKELILGRWHYDFRESYARVKRVKPYMTVQEIKRTRAALGAYLDATLTATLDKKVFLKRPSGKSSEGTWRNVGLEAYEITLREGNRRIKLDVNFESRNKMVARFDEYILVFEK